MSSRVLPVELPADRARGGRGDYAALLGATGLFHAARLGLTLWAAARLGPERFGAWNLLAALIGYASHAHLGVLTGMARDVPIALGGGNTREAAHLESVGLAGAVLAALGSLTLWVASLAVPALRAWADPALLLAAGAVASSNLIFLYTTMRARAKLQFRSQALQTGAAAIVMVSTYAAFGGEGLVGLAVALAAGHALGAAVGFALDPARPRLAALEAATLRRLVGVGLPLLSAGILFSLLTTADRWVLQAWLGTEAVGLYTLAILAFGAAILGPTVASQISYPEMAHALGRSGDPRALGPLVRSHSARGLAAGAAPALLLALALPIFVRAWLPDYGPGVAAALWVLPGVVAVGAAMGCANFLNTAGHHRSYLAVQGLGLVTNVVASSTAAWAGWGLAGVAAATSLSLCLYAGALAALARRKLG